MFAGATSARLSALQSGAVDAALLTPPHNFYAEAAGFSNLGWTIEYAREHSVLRRRSESRNGRRQTRRCSTVSSPPTTRRVNWFQDPGTTAQSAVKIMIKIGRLKQEDVEKSYDFLQRRKFL